MAAVPTCAVARSHCCFVTLVPWSTNQRDCHSADAPNTHVRNQAEIRFRAAQSSTHQLSVAAQEIRLLTTKIVKFIVHICRNLCRKSRAPKKNENVRKRSFFIHNSRRSSFIFFIRAWRWKWICNEAICVHDAPFSVPHIFDSDVCDEAQSWREKRFRYYVRAFGRCYIIKAEP